MAKNRKNNLIVKYDPAVDALSLILKRGREARFEEISPSIGIEFNSKGEVIGFEILNASRYLRRALPPLNKKVKELVLSGT